MKKIFLGLLLSPALLFAQVKIDRTKAPAPTKAPFISIPKPVIFTLANGLKVYVVQNAKLPRVSATLSLELEPILEGAIAGNADMAGSLMRRGTTTKTKAVLDEEIDFLGASISTSASGAFVASLATNFPKSFDLFSQVILSPSFDEKELEKVKKQTLSGLKSSKDNPESIASRVVDKLMYGANHPYGEKETEATIAKIGVKDVKEYYNTYWKPNAGYLIFVGDITPTNAKALAEKYFANWKKGNLPKPTYTTPTAPQKTIVAIIDRPASVQSVLKLVAPVQLKPGAVDDIPTDVMANILGGGFSGRLFANLREKYAFTYGAYADVNTDKLVGAFNANASVRNEKTDSAIGQFLYEFNRLKKEVTPADEVSRMKNYLSGAFARSLEQPSTVARFALNTAIYGLPADYYQKYLANLAAVDNKAVQAMANKYITDGNMYIVVVGNAKEVSKGLEKYGEVKYFDVNGNPTEAPSAAKKVDASITGLSIIQKAIAAYGGADAIASLKDVQMDGSVTVMGQNLAISNKYIFPVAYSTAVLFNGMAMQKEVINNGNYVKSQRGQSIPTTDEDKAEMDESAALIAENYHVAKDAKFVVKGIEQVEGEDAYAVEITPKIGKPTTAFYSVKTGLKVKSTEVAKSPQGDVVVSTYYKTYKTFNGVQLPVSMLIDQGALKLDINFTDVKVNTGIKVEDIK